MRCLPAIGLRTATRKDLRQRGASISERGPAMDSAGKKNACYINGRTSGQAFRIEPQLPSDGRKEKVSLSIG